MKPEALIVAQPMCAQWEQLPQAAQAARDLAEALTKHGYSLRRADLLDGGDKPNIEQALGEWFENVPAETCAVFFWTGHGSSDGGHYLVCRNSPRTELTALNAIDTHVLGPVIANCKADKILIVLDTCYSGKGAGEIASAFSTVLATRAPIRGRERAIAVIASAHPLKKVQEGVFCNVLRAVLLEPTAKRKWSDEDEFIHSEFLAQAVSSALPGDVSRPEYKADGIGQDFIPNPLYRPGRPAESVEERAWRLLSWTGAEHFDLSARGIEVGQSGWYFAGRTRLLRALVGWLENASHGVRIVTGPPGAGKSAVMGRLATLSDADYRKAILQAGGMRSVEEGTVPPAGIIDVAIHAKGKTLDDCARALARAFTAPIGKEVAVDIEALVTELRSIGRRLTIMIDALDEAAAGQGEIIATRLIVPLGRLERVRVLVGSRRSLDGMFVPQGEDRHGRLRAVFGPDALIADLEDEPTTGEDIAEYVRLRLAASPKHRDNPIGIAAVADRVAAQAAGVFLYARIASRTLQDLDRLDGELPATALEAFAHDLRLRFGAQEQRVDDLLAALAWGEGKGLTRRVWPIVANALAPSKHSYDEADVAWVLEHAGWHIIEAGEDGQTVYRLAHQKLADHYRGRMEVKEAQRRIVAALTRGVSGAGWIDSDRYLWRHLADHAAESGRLDMLIRDPGYLAVADPDGLVAALPCVQHETSRRFADVYNQVAERLIAESPENRLPLIHLSAQMEACEVARFLEPPRPTRWRCRWAQMRRATPHWVVGRHSRKVRSVAFGIVEGNPVVASGSDDETIGLWDARMGVPICKPIDWRPRDVTSVAFGMVNDRQAVVAGSDIGTIRLWDASTREPIFEPLEGGIEEVVYVALEAARGRAVVISASWDGLLCRWDAGTGQPVEEPLEWDRKDATHITFGAVDGRPIVVTGSWEGTIRLWDAGTRKENGEPLKEHVEVTAVALGMLDDRQVVVAGLVDGSVRLWDVRARKPIGEPLKGHVRTVTAVALGILDDRPVIVSGGVDCTIVLWDDPIGEPSGGHMRSVTMIAFGTIDDRPVVVSGSWEGTIRLWDARTGELVGSPRGGPGNSGALFALGTVNDRPVMIGKSAAGAIYRWDAETGEPIGEPLEGYAETVTSTALGMLDGRPAVVFGNSNGTIRLWHPLRGIGEPLGSHLGPISAVAFGTVDDRAVVISASTDGAIRLWDARTSKTFSVAIPGHMQRVTSVAIGTLYGRPIVASGSDDGTVRLWDAREGYSVGDPLRGHERPVTTVAFSSVGDRAIVASGSEDGTVRLWDTVTGQTMFLVNTGMPIYAVAARSGHSIAVAAARGILLLDIDPGTVTSIGNW